MTSVKTGAAIKNKPATSSKTIYAKLPAIVQFALKQAWAAIFGGSMLVALILTTYFDIPGINQYDALFICAILIQVFLLATGLEKRHEVVTIFVFHLTGLVMELFKTSPGIGSWYYPGDALLRVGTVPLFSGFMYAAVGSYLARSWRVMHLKFTNYPSRFLTLVLALAIYANFFAHHFIFDFRFLLFALTLWLYRKTMVKYKFFKKQHEMPLLLSFFIISLFIWLAENIGTYTKVWLYPSQAVTWEPVSLSKLGSWLLLMIISFIMIDIMHYLRTKKTNTRK